VARNKAIPQSKPALHGRVRTRYPQAEPAPDLNAPKPWPHDPEREGTALRQALHDAEHDRRLAEQARREWETALDALPDPIFIHDRQMRVVRANLAYARRAGLDIRDVIGRPYWEMFPKLPGPLTGCGQALDRKNCSREIIRFDSGEEFVSLAQPIYDGAGDYLYSLHILQDVTETRRAEAEQRVLSEALRQAAEAVVVLDRDSRITYLNPAFYALFGYAPEDVLGKPVSVLEVPGQDDDHQPCGIIRQLHDHDTWRGEVTRLAKNATAIPILMSAATIRDGHGEINGYVGTYLDLREVQRAEEALRAGELRFRALIENATDVVSLLDGNGTMLYESPSVERLLGYRPDELTGRNAFELIHPDDVAHTMRILRDAVLAPGTVQTGEFRFRHKDGSYRHVESIGRSLLDDPAVAGVVINSRDITQRRQTEDSLNKVNRALKVLSACNMALVHATSESDLLKEICRIIADLGGYQQAWVAYVVRDDPVALRAEAAAGIERAVAESFCAYTDGPDVSYHPLLQAIAHGHTNVIQDIDRERVPPAWRKQLRAHDIAASIHLPLHDNGRVFAVLNICAHEQHAFDVEEVSLLTEMANDVAYGIRALHTQAQRDQAVTEQQRGLERLRESLEDTIAAIAATLEMRDPYTAGHERRVAELATAVAQEMRLPPEQVQGLHFGALIHDLGKIRVPAEILSKPGRLTPVEFELIKGHAQSGYDILKSIKFPWPVAQMVLQHHERLDGSGYPNGLKGEAILLEARILAVADTVEAMSSHRPYRPARGIEAALEHIREMRGRHFDAAVVDACLQLFARGAFAFPPLI